VLEVIEDLELLHGDRAVRVIGMRCLT